MEPKVTLIIPAYNEAKNIGLALDIASEWRNQSPRKRRVIVVDDGSTDGTAKVAREKGVRAIYSDPRKHKNMGKAHAFVQGARHAKRNGSGVLVVLDADITFAASAGIERLVEMVSRSRADMVIAKTVEGGTHGTHFSGETLDLLSGQRAIRTSVLTPKLLARIKHFSGYGLEFALNHFIRNQALSESALFRTMPAFRKNGKRQTVELRVSSEMLHARKALARDLRELRQMGMHKEARELLAKRKKQHKFLR